MTHPRPTCLVLLATAVFVNAGEAPRLSSHPVRVHDFETLTRADALRLAGKPALYRIVLDSRAEEAEGRVAVDCTSADRVHRTVRLMPGVDAEGRDVLTVRARLQVLRHPLNWGYPDPVEYRLTDAVEVREPGRRGRVGRGATARASGVAHVDGPPVVASALG